MCNLNIVNLTLFFFIPPRMSQPSIIRINLVVATNNKCTIGHHCSLVENRFKTTIHLYIYNY